MIVPTQLGIWMDHSVAHLMEYSRDKMESKTVESSFTHQEKVNSLSKSESLMHNKEQHQQAEYYKNLGEIIKKYEEVLLFGPTDAKVELLNILKADHRFASIKVVVKQADKMTENQQHAFVKDYFLRHYNNPKTNEKALTLCCTISLTQQPHTLNIKTMIIFILIAKTGLVGLAVSIGMIYARNHPHPYGTATKQQTQQGRDDFYQRLKLNAARLRH